MPTTFQSSQNLTYQSHSRNPHKCGTSGPQTGKNSRKLMSPDIKTIPDPHIISTIELHKNAAEDLMEVIKRVIEKLVPLICFLHGAKRW
jgi:hypothetical protein